MSKRRRALDSDESDAMSSISDAPDTPARSRRRVTRNGSLAESEPEDLQPQSGSDYTEDAADVPELSGEESGDEKPTFPVKLQLGPRKPKAEDDDEYENSDSPSESASEDESLEQLSDTGFVVDSDDNVIKRSHRSRGRRLRRAPTYSAPVRSSRRLRKRSRTPSEDELSIRQELRDLRSPSPMRVERELRARQPVNYELRPPPTLEEIERLGKVGSTVRATEKRVKGGPIHSLYPVNGPFGGNDVISIFNPKKEEIEQTLEDLKAPLPNLPDAESNIIGASEVADTDTLGIETNIDFTSVGGLDDYIDRLKEMVSLPLLYPEVYQKFGITPPRGVLFHGPPGTGKTLMARALAASCTHNGKKITFFMRKGADCLSKWIGEAERQLRVLFDEAKAKQPSIIFFDEIDGLAPVRSSKQEQIHASIVSTLLALMDGMDNRGQVVVIGATNRPDSVDPALRRPGRFDREFYFPLPSKEARKQIVEIHTKKWNPPLSANFLEYVADMTKGYGGADLRALCTESALNAIQRTFPQIYSSDQRLLLDPNDIVVSPRDFVKSLDKIVPSSLRSSASGSSPLPTRIEPLLRLSFDKIKTSLDLLFPRQAKMTALQEAMYEDDDYDFGYQNRLRDFKSARIHRPRLLVHGPPGMGQEYMVPAVMDYLDGVHFQVIDLGNLFGDSMRTPESNIVQILLEAKKQTPSALIIPNLDLWYTTVSPQLRATFFSMMKSLAPTDKVLVVGLSSTPVSAMDPEIIQFFGFTSLSLVELSVNTSESALREFYSPLVSYIESPPTQTMELLDRPRRVIKELPAAPIDSSSGSAEVDEETLKRNQEKKDIKTRSQLKVKMGTLMETFKSRYRRFKKPAIDDQLLIHLFETPNPEATFDYVRADDDMVLELSTGNKYYNMDLDVIEDRLWNGFYSEPRQFLQDLELIHADALVQGDRERIHKSSEMLANAQVYIDDIADVAFLQACRDLRRREAEKQLRALENIDEDVPDNISVVSVVDNVVGNLGEKVSLPHLIPSAQANPDELHGSKTSDEDVSMVSRTPATPESDHAPRDVMDSKLHNPADPMVIDNIIARTETPLNHPAAPPITTDIVVRTTEPAPTLVVDRYALEALIDRLVAVSKGFDLEQLELTFAALVDVAWTHRREWDRTPLLDAVGRYVDSLSV